HPQERGADEKLERDERRDDVARETEDRDAPIAVAELPERERPSGPDRDRPKIDRAELGHDRLHVIVIAYGHTPARDDRVRGAGLPQCRAERIGRIAHDATDPCLPAAPSKPAP